MPRYSRRIMDMEDDELRAVIAVAIPGRKLDSMRREDCQEVAMKWLFAHGLSMNHEFTLERCDEEDEDDIYVLLSNKQACACCKKDTDTASVASFERSPVGSSLALYNKAEDDVHLTIPNKLFENRNNQKISFSEPVEEPEKPAIRRTSSGDINEGNFKRSAPLHRKVKSDDNILNNGKRAGPTAPPRTAKVKPITHQPTAATVPSPEDKKPEQEKGCCNGCCRDAYKSTNSRSQTVSAGSTPYASQHRGLSIPTTAL